jgi:hypothetical protein
MLFAQTFSISTSLLAAGGIATLSLFDVPEFQSQPASRSLPQTRWLFSRGSHIFPQAASLASAGFVYAAFSALPASRRAVTELVSLGKNGPKVNGFLTAAALAISIAPWTVFVMVHHCSLGFPTFPLTYADPHKLQPHPDERRQRRCSEL